MKRKTFKYPPAQAKSASLKETATVLEKAELVVNVRAAKDQLSSLLEQASRGNEVIIISDGQPKAKLVPIRQRRQAFRVNWDLLRSMPLQRTGPSAEQLVRDDRDGRD